MRSCKVQGCTQPPNITKHGWYCDKHYQTHILREIAELDHQTLNDIRT